MNSLAEILGAQPQGLPVMSPLARLGIKPTTLIVKQGKYYAVLPAEVNGQVLDPQTAAALWKSGKIKELGVFDSPEKAQAFTRKPAMSAPRPGATVAPIEPQPYPWADTLVRATKAPVAGLGKMGAAIGETIADLVGADTLAQRFAAQQEAWDRWGGPVSSMTPWQQRAVQAGQVAGMAAPAMLAYGGFGPAGAAVGTVPFLGLPYTESRAKGLSKPEALASAILQTGIEAAGSVPQAKAAFSAGQSLAGWLGKQATIQPVVETGEELLQRAVDPLVTGGRVPLQTLEQQAETAKETALTSLLAAPLMAAPGAIRPRATGPIVEPVQARLPVDMPLPETESKYNTLLPKLADRVWEKTFANGGATYSVFAGDRGGNKGYAVAVYPEREVIIPAEEFTPEMMQAYVAQNQDLLTKDPKANVGTWLNNESGMVHLDVVNVLPSLEKAVEMGEKNNQLAIFDLKNFEEIWLKRLISPEADPTDLNNWVPITDENHTLDIFENPPEAKYMKVDLSVPEQFKPIMKKAQQIVEEMEANQAQMNAQGVQAAPKWQPVINFEKESISAPPINIIRNTFTYLKDQYDKGLIYPVISKMRAFSDLEVLAKELRPSEGDGISTITAKHLVNDTFDLLRDVSSPSKIANFIRKYEPHNREYYAGLLYNAVILDDKPTQVMLRIMAAGPKNSIATRISQFILDKIDKGANEIPKLVREQSKQQHDDALLFQENQLPYAVGKNAYEDIFAAPAITQNETVQQVPKEQLALDFNKKDTKIYALPLPKETELNRFEDYGPELEFSRDLPAFMRANGGKAYRMAKPDFVPDHIMRSTTMKYAVPINLGKYTKWRILGTEREEYKQLVTALKEPNLGFLSVSEIDVGPGYGNETFTYLTPVIYFDTIKKAKEFAERIGQTKYIKIKSGHLGLEVPVTFKPRGKQLNLFNNITPKEKANQQTNIHQLIDERIVTFKRELLTEKRKKLNEILHDITENVDSIRRVGNGLNAPSIFTLNDGREIFVKNINAPIRSGFFFFSEPASKKASGFPVRARNEAFVDDVRALLGFNRIETVRYGETLYSEVVDLETIEELRLNDDIYRIEDLLYNDPGNTSIAETLALNIAFATQDMHEANIILVNGEYFTSIDNEFIIDSPSRVYFTDFKRNALVKFVLDFAPHMNINLSPLLRYSYYATDILSMAAKAQYNADALSVLQERNRKIRNIIYGLGINDQNPMVSFTDFYNEVISNGL